MSRKLVKRVFGHRRASEKGFTLIEILLVVVIISALAAMVVPRLTGRSEQAKEAIAKADIQANISTALKLYELDNGRYPTTEQGLKALTEKPTQEPVPQNWRGPYVEAKSIMDPWGRPYVYKYPGTHNNDYDLISLGKNGQDDDKAIRNWE
ncbi:MAG TPA: type II secretion system major pseudopilin GspG [Candidatus Omnitrophota bacterium]|nr:type II secretion system major pseudopilin GspG [Candidatus Omnitrophota bacterium]